ncbi:MAG: TonB-dependent receptor [Elusimicrobia bacterium]|nr:TonB-dependent receptor [Elusimicrobiota bacterium]
MKKIHILLVGFAILALAILVNHVFAEETAGESAAQPTADNQSALLAAPDAKYESVTETMLFMPIVITAAKKEQTIGEAAGVVTIITAEQIKQMGARNLMDVLRTVPGFAILQDSNEHLAVLRGIYASTNQKFLVMRDGHRLNDWMWNAIEHDYSISLANVKRIEIVRGPGASLYGSAALCGVVNIITQNAEEVDGTRLELGCGSPQQIKGDVVYGKKYNADEALLAWGSIYRTEGEKADISMGKDAATNRVDGYMLVDKRSPSYDVGMKIREGKFVFSGALRKSDYIQPGGNGGQLYVKDRKEIVEFRQTFYYGQLDLTWNDKIAELITVKLNQYWDYLYWESWQWAAQARDQLPQGRVFNWDVEGQSYGINYSGSCNLGEGSILIGIQAEQRDLFKSTASMNYSLPTGYPLNSNPVYLTESMLKPGGEYYLAAYAQGDYKFLEQIMINVGVRDDYYKDIGGSINPRVALIYNPDFLKEFYWKGIYGKAFLNPSYFYRFNSGKIGYFGGPDLKPEVMNSYQTEFSYYFGKTGAVKVVGFYNTLHDLISQKAGYTTYINYGKISMEGVEGEASVNIMDELSLFANYTFQKPDIGNTDPAQIVRGTIKNVPTKMANAGINYAPIKYVNLNLAANWHGLIESPTKTTMTDFGATYQIPQAVLLNLNIIAKEFFNTMEVAVNINNLLNTEYYLGGTVTPYRQPGRWILATVGYKF